MAQLKDLIVQGASRFIGDVYVNKLQLTSLSAPTTAGGTTYGLGTNGYVLTSNGSSIYWYPGLTLTGTAAASYLADFAGTTASTSTTTGAVKIAGGLGVAGQVTATRLDAGGSNTSYNLYINGTSYFNIGTSDTTSNKRIIVYGNNRFITIGGAGVQAYSGAATSTTASTFFINYNGGTLQIGQSTSTKSPTNLFGELSLKAGHLFLEGSQASSSTGNTTQIVFGTSTSQHIALSANTGAFIINPSTTSTTGQIVFKPGATSYISSGRLTINTSGNDSYNLYVNGTSYLKGDTTVIGNTILGEVNNSTATNDLVTINGKLVIDPSYNQSSNSYNEGIRINRASNGWSGIYIGGTRGTTSATGLGTWLIATKSTPANATTAAASITDSQFYISYNGSDSAACRITGHNATGFSIRPHLSINADIPSNTTHAFYVNGTSYFNGNLFYKGDLTFEGPGTRHIKYTGTKETYSMIRFIDNTSDTYGNGVSIGGGGQVIIGSGESATALDSIYANGGSETTYIVSDGSIFLEANANTVANRVGLQIDTSGNLIPTKTETTNNSIQDIGTNTNRWKTLYLGNLTLGGTIDTDAGKTIASNSTLYLKTTSSASVIFGINGSNVARFDTSGYFKPEANNTYDIGLTATRWRTGYFATALNIGAASTSNTTTTSHNTYISPASIILNAHSAAGGFYLYKDGVQYAREFISTVGTAGTATTYTNPEDSTQTVTGYTGNTTGIARLILGNDKAVGTNGSDYSNPGTAGTANNAQGQIYLYGANTRAVYIEAITTSYTANRAFYIPNYNGAMYAVHNAGSAVGSATLPVYVTAAGRVTACTASSVFGALSWTAGTTAGPTLSITVAGQNRTSAIPSASASASGAVTTGAQTFAGAKTFSGVATFSNTTASSSKTTGAVIISGGLGVAGSIYGNKIYGAVWNDYAEYRNTKEEIEAGRVIQENGDDTLRLANGRLLPGCEIVSDTFGFAIGKTEQCGTPVAATGRVLAYPYEDRELFRTYIGSPVCSGPNGTVSIMTEEEEMKYPSRIIGTISAVPDYEEWGEDSVKVSGRVWIRIR